jgi:penicillin-binding protein 1A
VEDPRTAYQMVSLLQGVVQRGTGHALKELGIPLAGKTGTTSESKDAWFMGFTPDLVAGVYIGFDDPQPLGTHETGATVAVPVFKRFMAEATKDKPAIPFRVPPGLRMVRISASTGALASIGDKDAIWEAYIPGTEPQEGDVRPILDGSVTGAASEGAAGAITPATSTGETEQPITIGGAPGPSAKSLEQENVRVLEGSRAPMVISAPPSAVSPEQPQPSQPPPAFKVDHPAANSNSSPSTMGTGGLY